MLRPSAPPVLLLSHEEEFEERVGLASEAVARFDLCVELLPHSESADENSTKPFLNQASFGIKGEAAPGNKPFNYITVDEARDRASRSEIPSSRRRTGSGRREPTEGLTLHRTWEDLMM